MMTTAEMVATIERLERLSVGQRNVIGEQAQERETLLMALRALVEPLRELAVTEFIFTTPLAEAFVAAQSLLGYGDISALVYTGG